MSDPYEETRYLNAAKSAWLQVRKEVEEVTNTLDSLRRQYIEHIEDIEPGLEGDRVYLERALTELKEFLLGG